MSNLAQLHFSVILRPWILVWLRVAPCKGIKDTLGFWIPRRGFRIPATGFRSLSVELGLWISIVSGSPDFLSCIPDSKAQDSRFHKHIFPRILDSVSKISQIPESRLPYTGQPKNRTHDPPLCSQSLYRLRESCCGKWFLPSLVQYLEFSYSPLFTNAKYSRLVIKYFEALNEGTLQRTRRNMSHTCTQCQRLHAIATCQKKNIKRELHFHTVNNSCCIA